MISQGKALSRQVQEPWHDSSEFETPNRNRKPSLRLWTHRSRSKTHSGIPKTKWKISQIKQSRNKKPKMHHKNQEFIEIANKRHSPLTNDQEASFKWRMLRFARTSGLWKEPAPKRKANSSPIRPLGVFLIPKINHSRVKIRTIKQISNHSHQTCISRVMFKIMTPQLLRKAGLRCCRTREPPQTREIPTFILKIRKKCKIANINDDKW